jgi:hypothetical protein
MSSGPLTTHVEGVYSVQWLLKNLIADFGAVAHPPLWFQHGDVQVETVLPPKAVAIKRYQNKSFKVLGI